jgi:hypothetical protein
MGCVNNRAAIGLHTSLESGWLDLSPANRVSAKGFPLFQVFRSFSASTALERLLRALNESSVGFPGGIPKLLGFRLGEPSLNPL